MNKTYIVVRTFFLLLLILLPYTLYGQSRNSVGTRLFDFNLASRLHTPKQDGCTDLQKIKKPRTTSDTVRYASIVKQHGWYKGIGKPLTKEHASHLSVHFRMTQKNAAGHWTRIEAINGCGDLTTKHGLWAYAISGYDEGDTLANKEWVKKMQTICQWDFVYEGKGEKCLIERAYNKEGELIFAFTPVQINDSVFIGTYLDNNGRPANLRGDKGASLVKITNDKNGYNTKIELLDENGYNIKNRNGVIMSRYYHNDEGHVVKIMSCNAIGDPVLDDWGNCGGKYQYDSNGNLREYVCINQFGEPIPMPESNRNRDGDIGVTIKRCEYDKWGRTISISFFDKDNNPQANNNGVHRCEMAYNEHGFETYRKWFNLKNEPTPVDSTGIYSEHLEYNKKGRVTLYELFDRNGNYINKEDKTCKEVLYYLADETTLKRIDNYTAVDGKPILDYAYYKKGDAEIKEWYYNQEEKRNKPNNFWYEEKAPTYKKYKYNNGINTIDSIDSHQNTVYSAVFYKNGSPAMMNGIHEYHAKYNYIDETHFEFTSWHKDSLGNYANFGQSGISINIQSVDKKKWIDERRYYDAKRRLIGSVMRKWKANFESLISETACNFIGIPSRNDHAGVEYLKNYVTNNLNGGFSAFVGRNEFDEPAYIGEYPNVYYYKLFMPDKPFQYYDENSHLITNMDSLSMNMPYATVIEVFDSVGYQKGFKDNDVIVQYGDWYYPLKGVSNRNSSLGLLLEMIKKRNESKSMTILRYYPEMGKSEVLHKDVEQGKLSDYGVNIHVIPYTQKELDRLRYSLDGYLKSNDIAKQWKEYAPIDSLYGYPVEICRPFNSGKSYMWYEANVRDPYIIIDKDTLTVENDVPEVKIKYTTDFENISELKYKGKLGSLAFPRFYISAEDKKKFVELNRELNKE